MRVWKCFYNDDDGLSITDTLALFFSLVYLVIIAVMLYCLFKAHLTETHLDFLEITTWPVLTILGGYFGDRIVSNLGAVASARRHIRTSNHVTTQSASTELVTDHPSYNEDTGPL